MYGSTKHGFTLIEVIIAITIGALLILVTSASIRTGLTFMQRGEERFNKGLKERVAINFFTQQITSIRPYSTEDQGIFFVGDKDLVSFISPLSLNKYYTQGLMICAYTITKDEYNAYQLVYSEKRLLSNKYLGELAEGFSKETKKREFFDEEAIVFFQGCKKITIEYLGEVKPDKGEVGAEEEGAEEEVVDEEEEGPWKKSWETGGIPKAIKITLLKRGEIQKAVAPIMVSF